MNIINIILLAILLISFISGMQKGFLASLLATLGFVVAWLIASSLCGTLANHFMNSSFKEALSGLDPFRELVAKLGENGSVLCNGAASTLNGICETLTEASVPKAVIVPQQRRQPRVRRADHRRVPDADHLAVHVQRYFLCDRFRDCLRGADPRGQPHQ